MGRNREGIRDVLGRGGGGGGVRDILQNVEHTIFPSRCPCRGSGTCRERVEGTRICIPLDTLIRSSTSPFGWDASPLQH